VTDTDIPLLKSGAWATSYRHEDGNLVELFYVPALSCAATYDRMTGYFSASALALAARGIERLIACDGRMRLLVGCTLGPNEIEALEKGYDLRDQVEKKLIETPLTLPDPTARGGLEALAWLVANGRLDVKVAVPTNEQGKPVSVTGIYHEKVGIITDRENNRLSFSGSINETQGGWLNNRESFHVHLSWESGREFKHVQDEVDSFERMWEGRAWSVKVLDFPEAVKAKLLEFLPLDDRFVAPPKKPPVENAAEETVLPPALKLLPDEIRRAVWDYIANAARAWNGERVGEVTSTVSPWPHQVRATHRLVSGWPCQMLIADEVGLGKTITAGLFLRQSWLSRQARRILVMVPASLLPQWQGELYEKFNLNVPIYDGQKLVWRETHGWQGPATKKVGRTDWHKEPFVLCSSHLMRRRDRASDLVQAEDWDLILLDEAHHARRKSPGTPQEGGPNSLLKLMQQLRTKTRSLLLMTATPMQVHPVELFDLLRLLGLPGRWGGSRETFLRYFAECAGNPSQEALEFLAALFCETESAFGEVTEGQVATLIPTISKLSCRKILKALRDSSGIPLKRLDVAQRKAAIEILRRFSPVRHRMSRHTRNLLREYHRRGLIHSPIAKRDVRDIPIPMLPAERALYDAVGDYISQTYNNASPDKRAAIGFVLTIYQRRIASSFFALQQSLNNRLGKMDWISDEDVSQDEAVDEVMDKSDAEAMSQAGLAEEERETIRVLLKKIAKVGTNSKARELKIQLEIAFADEYDSAIVFTQYADTMEFLKEFLAGEFPGKTVGSYSQNGGAVRDQAGFWSKCTKEQIKLRLKSKLIQILVCTDAAAEGLNFQSCGVLVNYDLPWNPMKVEQRIGRIDRIGQKYPVIRIVNLAYQNTVEADVYFALGTRINLFEGLIGRLQPILSRLPKQFEEVGREKKENQEAARQRLLADLDQATRDADSGGLDVDEVAAEAMEMPKLPTPALTLNEIDEAFNRPGILPVGSEWRRLDAGSYALRMPGMTEEIRVTTRAEVFDDHFESHDFMSPGSQVFSRLSPTIDAGRPDAVQGEGRIWRIDKRDEATCRYVALRNGEPAPCNCLRDLIGSFEFPGVSASAESLGLTENEELICLC
jgi:ERCC4-related helicase